MSTQQTALRSVPTGRSAFGKREGITVFDVVYVDRQKQGSVLAAGLHRQAAVDLACREARKRRVGRMFLAGSEPPSDVVVIVASPQRAA
jgi:hypothetical protein